MSTSEDPDQSSPELFLWVIILWRSHCVINVYIITNCHSVLFWLWLTPQPQQFPDALYLKPVCLSLWVTFLLLHSRVSTSTCAGEPEGRWGAGLQMHPTPLCWFCSPAHLHGVLCLNITSSLLWGLLSDETICSMTNALILDLLFL